MRRLTINGASFEYLDEGEGTPVVLLHGAPTDCRMWAPHCAAVAPHHRAVAYTQRYFGTAPWPADGLPFGVRTHANDLVAFITQLGAGPVHLAAWSYAD